MGTSRIHLVGRTAAILVCLFVSAVSTAQAEFVTVGDPGNVGEYQPQLGWFGGVNYVYDIGKYEVTAAEYVVFLNAAASSDPHGLYNTAMASGYGCRITRSGSAGSYTYAVAGQYSSLPVNYVSWYDAARYCNWLTSGDSESGAYQFDGSAFIGVDRPAGAAVSVDGMVYLLPTENEWYKAAYYDPTRTEADKYWWYPTRSDSPPSRDSTEAMNPGNNANHTEGLPYVNYGPWAVGTCYLSSSYYGTFDQGGNVAEWNESIGWRGGSWEDGVIQLGAEQRHANKPATDEFDSLGFRVIAISAAAIPEPSAALLLLFGAVAALLKRRR